jgi:hypothetical protein
MKGFAYVILIVVIMTIILEPFMETIQVFVEKSKIDSAIRNSGRLAMSRSVKDTNRADLDSTVDLDAFRKRFNEGFAAALDLEVTSSSGNKSHFKSMNNRFNDFDVEFIIDPDQNKKGFWTVKAESKYKYKTRYLKYVEKQAPNLTVFLLGGEQRFSINIVN